MALAIKNRTIYNNDEKWEDFFIVDEKFQDVYAILLDSDDNVILEKIDRPDNNRMLIDEETKRKYYMVIIDRTLGLLEEEYDACSNEVICDKMDELLDINNKWEILD